MDLISQYAFHPTQTIDMWDFFVKHPIAQKRGYSCDMTSTRQANEANLTLDRQSSPVLWQKSRLCYLGMIPNTMLFIPQIEMFSSISRDCMSLQAPCQLFVDRSTWLESSIPRSFPFDVEIHFIYMMCHTTLLLLAFITFRVLNSIVSYRRSKRVMKVGEFDRRWPFLWRAKNFIQWWSSFHFTFPLSSRSQKVNSLANSACFGSRFSATGQRWCPAVAPQKTSCWGTVHRFVIINIRPITPHHGQFTWVQRGKSESESDAGEVARPVHG
jgi:hypothetical protein